MSLKIFHIVFILFSTALFVIFGIHNMKQGPILGISTFLVGAGLILYGLKFIAKFKDLKIDR